MSEGDLQLIERARRGEQDAFEQLFLAYYGPVYRVAYGLVASREEAEDLVQETFLALYSDPPHLRPGSSLVAWLCRVALNRGYNALRSARRSRERLELVGRLDVGVADGPEGEFLRVERQGQVRAALAALPERQSHLLLLRYAGLAYAEIAEILHVAPGSIGTLLARAERAFVAAFEPEPAGVA